MALDDVLENIELNIVRGSGVRDITIIEEKFLHLLTLMYAISNVTPIINNQVRSVTLTKKLRLYQGIKDGVPVLLETLTLIGKHISRFIMINDSHIVVLGRENVAKSPTEVTAEGLESLNQH